MSDSTSPILTADGTPLKAKLAQTTRRLRIKALLLTLPLVIFIIITFVLPIGQMLYRSVHNPTGIMVTPNFAEAIQEWDGEVYQTIDSLKSLLKI